MRCEAWATVCFNFCTSGTDDANHIFVPFSDSSKNKNPAESGESSSNSAGSTALRLVEAMGVEPSFAILRTKPTEITRKFTPILSKQYYFHELKFMGKFQKCVSKCVSVSQETVRRGINSTAAIFFTLSPARYTASPKTAPRSARRSTGSLPAAPHGGAQ